LHVKRLEEKAIRRVKNVRDECNTYTRKHANLVLLSRSTSGYYIYVHNSVLYVIN